MYSLSEKQKSKFYWIRKVFSFAIVIILFFFLGQGLIRNWKNIPFHELRFNGWWVILSYVCLFASFTLSTIIWIHLLKGMSARIGLLKAMRSIALSQVGRYAPGRIWSFVGRTELGKQESIPRPASSIGLLLETELQIVSSSLVFLIAFGFSLGHWHTSLPKGLYLILLLIPLELVLLHPAVTNSLTSFLFRLFRREAPHVDLRYWILLKLTFFYFISWTLGGLGFYFLAKSVFPLSWSTCVAMTGAYPAAWLIGFISLITPSGLGVREGVLVVLISPIMPTSMAVTLSLLARIWTTFFEGACFLVFLRA